MPTAVSFAARYPEFSNTDSDLVGAVLAEAALSVDPLIYGFKADAAVSALAAHLLWTGEAGTSLRMAADGDTSPDAQRSRYWGEFTRLRRECTVGFMVL
ncbi:MAG: DUF4054 domain-containing protein [Chthoniobacterales bacterium]|nr:DUF4054 domain-containing protein [Chthoniobacterales bacterium]